MRAMDEELERRIGRNESLFREVNEAIRRGLWPGEEGERVRFRCECAQLDCNEVITITAAEYERVRANPRRFLVINGHELPEFESVVESRPDYLVVEKRDAAGAEAAKLDHAS
jgi:hypothetical protein